MLRVAVLVLWLVFIIWEFVGDQGELAGILFIFGTFLAVVAAAGLWVARQIVNSRNLDERLAVGLLIGATLGPSLVIVVALVASGFV